MQSDLAQQFTVVKSSINLMEGGIWHAQKQNGAKMTHESNSHKGQTKIRHGFWSRKQ